MQKSEPKPKKMKQKTEPANIIPFPIPVLMPNWKERLKLRVNKLGKAHQADLWSSL